jgi:hypothetical protein
VKRWLKSCLLIAIFINLNGMSLSEALDILKTDRYGFVFVDAGITNEDLELFNCLNIQNARVYHRFGELEQMRDEIADFFIQMGANKPEFAFSAADRLSQIAQEVVQTSGKETAWVFLRAFLPTDRYDLPRWHMDGAYHRPEGPADSLCKFIVTLVGSPTLFYQLPPEFRSVAERNVRDRNYMKRFCLSENIVVPRRGEGAIFNPFYESRTAGLHSEPPIRENRLFFSIVPCMEKNFADLKKRVLFVYPKPS